MDCFPAVFASKFSCSSSWRGAVQVIFAILRVFWSQSRKGSYRNSQNMCQHRRFAPIRILYISYKLSSNLLEFYPYIRSRFCHDIQEAKGSSDARKAVRSLFGNLEGKAFASSGAVLCINMDSKIFQTSCKCLYRVFSRDPVLTGSLSLS